VTERSIELTRRKILLSTTAVGIAGAGAGLGTSALYGDSEEFGNNLIQAGTTNLIAEAEVVDVSSGLENNGTVELTDADSDDGSDNGVLEADGAMVAGLTVQDMKPGDSFILRVTVEVEDNPMYVAATAVNADDSEGVNTEPENSTQNGGSNPDVEDGTGAGNGSDAVGDGSDDDAGDLDNELLVTFGYDDAQVGTPGNVDGTLDDTDGSGDPKITPDPGLGLDGSSSATATSFIDTLQGSGLTYRNQASGTADPPGGHGDGLATRIGGDANASNVDREQVTHFIKFELPVNVGNEVQGDSFSFDLGFATEQVRNNDDPFGTGSTTTINIPDEQTIDPLRMSDSFEEFATVTVSDLELPDDGFVAVRANDGGSPGEVLAHTFVIPAGSYTDEEFLITPTVEAVGTDAFSLPGITTDADVIATVHTDDGDFYYEFVPGAGVTADMPYTNGDGALTDEGRISVS
jgi:hypothetical protein